MSRCPLAEDAQRLARAGEWWLIGRAGCLRIQAPDRLRGWGQQFPRRIDDRRFFLQRQPLLEAVAFGVVERRQEQRVVTSVRSIPKLNQ